MVDIDKLLERTGGDEELLFDILGIFLDLDCDSRLADIHAAFDTQDSEILHRATHAFKGSVANFSSPPASEAATLLDQLARQGKVEEAREAFSEVERIVEELRGELDELRQTIAEKLSQEHEIGYE